MIEDLDTTPKIHITIRGEDKDSPSLVYEGDLEMSTQEQDVLKQLIGDGRAKVTASREMSHKDYGNGGSVFVSVTLTCDQSQTTIDAAASWAGHFAEKNAVTQHSQLQQTLTQLGVTS